MNSRVFLDLRTLVGMVIERITKNDMVGTDEFLAAQAVADLISNSLKTDIKNPTEYELLLEWELLLRSLRHEGEQEIAGEEILIH